MAWLVALAVVLLLILVLSNPDAAGLLGGFIRAVVIVAVGLFLLVAFIVITGL